MCSSGNANSGGTWLRALMPTCPINHSHQVFKLPKFKVLRTPEVTLRPHASHSNNPVSLRSISAHHMQLCSLHFLAYNFSGTIGSITDTTKIPLCITGHYMEDYKGTAWQKATLWLWGLESCQTTLCIPKGSSLWRKLLQGRVFWGQCTGSSLAGRVAGDGKKPQVTSSFPVTEACVWSLWEKSHTACYPCAAKYNMLNFLSYLTKDGGWWCV